MRPQRNIWNGSFHIAPIWPLDRNISEMDWKANCSYNLNSFTSLLASQYNTIHFRLSYHQKWTIIRIRSVKKSSKLFVKLKLINVNGIAIAIQSSPFLLTVYNSRIEIGILRLGHEITVGGEWVEPQGIECHVSVITSLLHNSLSSTGTIQLSTIKCVCKSVV